MSAQPRESLSHLARSGDPCRSSPQGFASLNTSELGVGLNACQASTHVGEEDGKRGYTDCQWTNGKVRGQDFDLFDRKTGVSIEASMALDSLVQALITQAELPNVVCPRDAEIAGADRSKVAKPQTLAKPKSAYGLHGSK